MSNCFITRHTLFNLYTRRITHRIKVGVKNKHTSNTHVAMQRGERREEKEWWRLPKSTTTQSLERIKWNDLLITTIKSTTVLLLLLLFFLCVCGGDKRKSSRLQVQFAAHKTGLLCSFSLFKRKKTLGRIRMRKNMLNNNRPKASSNSLLVCDNRSPRKRERERERLRN